MPDPSNPQAFNRYSYVYNNPVGYVDPTGQILVHADQQLEDSVMAILDSADTLGLGQIQAHIRWLIQSDREYRIDWGSVNYTDLLTRNVTIDRSLATLDSQSQNLRQAELASLIGHELWHAKDAYLADSIQEELTAFHVQYDIRLALGDSFRDTDVVSRLRYLSPSSTSDLREAKKILTTNVLTPQRYFYNILPLKPASGLFSRQRNAWYAVQQLCALALIALNT